MSWEFLLLAAESFPSDVSFLIDHSEMKKREYVSYYPAFSTSPRAEAEQNVQDSEAVKLQACFSWLIIFSKAHLPSEMSPAFCVTYLAPALLARVI